MSQNLTPDERRNRFLGRQPNYEWRQEGAFSDADGRPVRAYDDVFLLEPIAIEGDEDGVYRIPAGTIATVLFFQSEPDGLVDLECYWPSERRSFGFAKTRSVRLHQTNEEKYRR